MKSKFGYLNALILLLLFLFTKKKCIPMEWFDNKKVKTIKCVINEMKEILILKNII